MLCWVDDACADLPYAAGMETSQPSARPGWVRRRWRWGWPAEVALAVLVGVLQVGGTALAGRHQPDARPLDAAGYLLLAAAAAALMLRRRWPVASLVVAFTATFGYALANYPGGPIWAPLIITFGTVLVAGHRVVSYVSLLLGYVCFGWLSELPRGGPFPSVSAAVGIAAWMLFLAAVSEVVRGRRAYLHESRQRAFEEQRSREEEARHWVSEQRLGIARELHDVLAHSISLINVQAGVALELIDQRPEQARTALTAIKQASKEALVEVQSVLGALREDGPAPRTPAPSLTNIEDLLRRAGATGLKICPRITGDPRQLPASVDAAAYRVVQEALTNVVRHAAASTVVVRLNYGARQLTVDVDDNGHGPLGVPAADGGGHGIPGMRERVAALGGRLDAGAKEGGGFRLHAWLPLPDSHPDGAS